MRLIDEQYMETSFYGSRRIATHLKHLGYRVNRKRLSRRMCLMGTKAINTEPKTTTINKDHKIYPYLLRDYEVAVSNEVRSADITYIPMEKRFMCLVAILDWYSGYVIALGTPQCA